MKIMTGKTCKYCGFEIPRKHIDYCNDKKIWIKKKEGETIEEDA